MTIDLPDIAIIDTGFSNLASVESACGRLGVGVRRISDPESIATADGVVLPGVGHFAEGMARLSSLGLVEPLRLRIQLGRPTLAICLGMQLLAQGSDEAPGIAGLGVVAGRVRRLPPARIRPHLGWNLVTAAGPEPRPRFLVDDGAASFANGFALDAAPTGWATAWSDDHGPFVAAIERGAVLACQFHPEISGRWGATLLGRWMSCVLTESATCC